MALLQNCGKLPLTFCLDPSSHPALAESVSVVPRCGLIQPGLHQIITLRATPTEESPEQGFCLQLQLNAAQDRPAKVLHTLHWDTEVHAETLDAADSHTCCRFNHLCVFVSVPFRS